MNQDFLDFLAALDGAGAHYLVVGAHALAVHSEPRATGDLDIFVDPHSDNAKRVWQALVSFGAPVSAVGLTVEDLSKPDLVYQIGLPPRRIDVLTAISGVDFEAAWFTRVTVKVGDREVAFLGRDALVHNKRASGRPKDLADLAALGEKP
jgi:hypothetical protein